MILDARLYISRTVAALILGAWHPEDAHELLCRLLVSYGRSDHVVHDPGEIAMEPWCACVHTGAEETLGPPWWP